MSFWKRECVDAINAHRQSSSVASEASHESEARVCDRREQSAYSHIIHVKIQTQDMLTYK